MRSHSCLSESEWSICHAGLDVYISTTKCLDFGNLVDSAMCNLASSSLSFTNGPLVSSPSALLSSPLAFSLLLCFRRSPSNRLVKWVKPKLLKRSEPAVQPSVLLSLCADVWGSDWACLSVCMDVYSYFISSQLWVLIFSVWSTHKTSQYESFTDVSVCLFYLLICAHTIFFLQYWIKKQTKILLSEIESFCNLSNRVCSDSIVYIALHN